MQLFNQEGKFWLNDDYVTVSSDLVFEIQGMLREFDGAFLILFEDFPTEILKKGISLSDSWGRHLVKQTFNREVSGVKCSVEDDGFLFERC